ncbi:MAG: S8 family serine peptidase, partial [Catalinimonas sp.]
IDVGFYNAHKQPALAHLFEGGRIAHTRDFVTPGREDFFGTAETGLDNHGTQVLMMIAGRDTAAGRQWGFAPDARYCLARTDHGRRESRVEEDYWVAALEWMDSLGVRLVNTSLGYGLGFDDPAENYAPEQMDGRTSLVARAAQIATEERGMIIVVSAGNDGNNPRWRYVSTPADAAGVLTVGATTFDVWRRMGYSGVGPEYLPYVKPDVACFSLTGTSFAAPVVAGFAACLLQRTPDLAADSLLRLVKRSGHLYPYGNNHVGWGVPRTGRALALLAGEAPAATAESIMAKGNRVKLRVGGEQPRAHALLYHKKDAWRVIEQQEARVRWGKLLVERPEGAVRTTVDLRDRVIEVRWQ